jgi:mono/diheme cytochrome c family protein
MALEARRTAVAGLIAVGLGIAVPPAWAEDDELVKRGRAIAEAACADCHAIGTVGDSTKAEAPRFRELGRKYPVESLEEALAEGVVVGHPEMPQVKMSEPDIGAFLAYLKSVQIP